MYKNCKNNKAGNLKFGDLSLYMNLRSCIFGGTKSGDLGTTAKNF